MYCHIKDYEIRFTDADVSDYLKLSSLLSLMEESACLSAEELGFGYSVLQPKKYGFIMVNWYIDLFRPIKLGEVLSVHTWPIKPKKLIVFRDYELYVGSEKVGVATSRWCLVDLNSFTMLPTSSVFDEKMQYNENRAVEVSNFKISEIAVEEPCYCKQISYSDYDHYNHANNTKYADFLMDAFTIEDIKDKWLSSVRITYVKQSKYGEILQVYKQEQQGGTYILCGKVDDELRVQMAVKLDE